MSQNPALWLVAPIALMLLVPAVDAQTTTTPTPIQHKPDPYGSPLDTIMSTRLWTDVPQARSFVRESRPGKDLQYTPLTGTEPVRPKPRDAANVMALQAELEESGARNTARADGLRPRKSRRAARHDAQEHDAGN